MAPAPFLQMGEFFSEYSTASTLYNLCDIPAPAPQSKSPRMQTNGASRGKARGKEEGGVLLSSVCFAGRRVFIALMWVPQHRTSVFISYIIYFPAGTGNISTRRRTQKWSSACARQTGAGRGRVGY